MNFAFVLIAEPALPPGEAIVKEFAAFAKEGQQLKFEKAGASKPDGTTLAFQLDPCGMAFVALLPSPVPNREADEAARLSFSAITTDWELPSHRAHLLVTLMLSLDSMSSLTKLSCLTSVLAAVSKASSAVGIYWGEGRATHDPEMFQAMAQRPQLAARMTLWTGVSIAREAGRRLSLLSLGMQQLNLPDLLMTAPETMDSEELLGMFFDLLAYVAQRGEPLPEGDTVGRADGGRVSVHYVASPLEKTKQVWRVELE